MKQVYIYTGDCPSRAHPIYKEFSRYCPQSFSFIPSSEDFFFSPPPSKRKSFFTAQADSRIKSFVLKSLILAGVPRFRYIRIPQGTVLVHSGQYPLLNKIPWVMDFEQAAVIGWLARKVIDKPYVKFFFERLFASDYCRGLLGWTSAASQSLLNTLDCSKFKDKIKTAHMTIIPQDRVDRSGRRKTIELLFCSRDFYCKGGFDAILAVSDLVKNYDVHLTVVSQTPPEVLKQFGNHPRMTFYKSVSVARRYDLMREADILIHPGHSETYGFVILEAFSFGLPVISTDGYSSPELVQDGVRGYAVKNYLSWFDEKLLPWVRTKNERDNFFKKLQNPPRDYIDRLASAISKLIESPESRLSMGENAFQSVTSGMFSPRYRKEFMRDIYNQALN